MHEEVGKMAEKSVKRNHEKVMKKSIFSGRVELTHLSIVSQKKEN